MKTKTETAMVTAEYEKASEDRHAADIPSFKKRVEELRAEVKRTGSIAAARELTELMAARPSPLED